MDAVILVEDVSIGSPADRPFEIGHDEVVPRCHGEQASLHAIETLVDARLALLDLFGETHIANHDHLGRLPSGETVHDLLEDRGGLFNGRKRASAEHPAGHHQEQMVAPTLVAPMARLDQLR